MLVWNAMPSMTPMMSPMRLELALMSAIVETTCSTTSPPRAAAPDADDASSLALEAESAVCETVPVSSSIDAAVCWRFEAVCSVRADRSWLPAAICPEAVAIDSVVWRTCETVWRSEAIIAANASSRLPGTGSRTMAARLPCATCFIAATASRGSPPIWRSTLRAMAKPSPPITRKTPAAMPSVSNSAVRTAASTSSM